MSLPYDQSTVSYVGNNSTMTPYPVPFSFFLPEDLFVVVTDVDGVPTALFLNVDYSVSGGDPESGASGNINTVEAVIATSTVSISREVQITQDTEFTGIGKFPSHAVDRALDKLTMICQQVMRGIARTFRLPDTSSDAEALTPVPNVLIGLGSDSLPRTFTPDEVITLLDLETTITDRPTKTFDDYGQRQIAVPDFVGQIGVQKDTGEVFVSHSTSVGDWINSVWIDNLKLDSGQQYLSLWAKNIYAGTASNIALVGDSTMLCSAVSDPNQKIDVILGNVINRFSTNVTITNWGVNGQTAYAWNTTPSGNQSLTVQLATSPTLWIINWGVNDANYQPGLNQPGLTFSQAVAQFETNYRAGLARIRSTQGDESVTSILLLSPHASAPGTGGLQPYVTDAWHQAINPIIRKAAFDYKCAFIDTYAHRQDPRVSWYVDAAINGLIHPQGIAYFWEISQIVEMILPYGARSSAPQDIFSGSLGSSTLSLPPLRLGSILTATSGQPAVYLVRPSSSADQRQWGLVHGSDGACYLLLQKDDFSSFASALRVYPGGGNSINRIEFPTNLKMLGPYRSTVSNENQSGERVWEVTNASANQKLTRCYTSNTSFLIEFVADAFASAVTALEITRSGTTPTSFVIPAPIILLEQSSDPAAPAANKAELYSRDNGSGKTQLCVRFPTGAVQVISTEP